MLEDDSTPHGKRYFVNLSWVIPCCEQKLGIGAQATCIACNDTSVIVINFRKSKTHAITDTYCTWILRKKMATRLVYPARQVATKGLNFFAESALIWFRVKRSYAIDLLPNYGPGTSKRYRKPVTTGNTVISNCEKRIFRRSSDLAEAKI